MSEFGNRPAQKLMAQVFEVAGRQWRGIGAIPLSGYRLRPEFAAHDAAKVFGVWQLTAAVTAECISALVLQGLKKPPACAAFGARCTPESPLGA